MRTFVNSRQMAMVLAMETINQERAVPPRARRRVRRTRRGSADDTTPGHA